MGKGGYVTRGRGTRLQGCKVSGDRTNEDANKVLVIDDEVESPSFKVEGFCCVGSGPRHVR